jgi:hypothetical protein
MRMRFDRRRSVIALGFLWLAIVSLGIAWANWPDSPAERCAQPDISNNAIRECVAAQAHATEPTAGTLVALLIGATALAGSLIAGARATRRVMTVAEAARELHIEPYEVRRLIDAGVLEIYDQEPGSIYLRPEQVHRVAVQGSS